jgi:hypothetical protein
VSTQILDKIRLSDFDSEYCFYEDEIGSDILLIIFAYINQPLSIKSHYHYLSGLRCSKLFLNSGRNDWYQAGVPSVAGSFSELLDFCKRLSDEEPERRLLFLGHSMGGFAAIGAGLAVGHARVLASVPEIELLQPGSMSLRHMQPRKPTYPSLIEMLAQNRTTAIEAILGDKDPYDVAVAERLGEMPNTDVIMVPSDHGVFWHLKEQGTLRPTLAAFVAGNSVRSIVSPS